jgi:hypothetical protein
MSRLASEPRHLSQRPGDEWQGRSELAERDRGRRGGGMGLLIAGLAVIGLGALTWYYIGPDIRRYMKMRSM